MSIYIILLYYNIYIYKITGTVHITFRLHVGDVTVQEFEGEETSDLLSGEDLLTRACGQLGIDMADLRNALLTQTNLTRGGDIFTHTHAHSLSLSLFHTISRARSLSLSIYIYIYIIYYIYIYVYIHTHTTNI